TGGAGAATAQGIRAAGLGDVNVYTGAGSIISTSTAGGSWGIRVNGGNAVAGSAGGAVTVDTQGLVQGIGGILAVSTGLETTDGVTVNTGGSVIGTTGNGLDARSANGNVLINVSGNVSGANAGGPGAGEKGAILGNATGTGSVTINKTGNGTVTVFGNATTAGQSNLRGISARTGNGSI